VPVISNPGTNASIDPFVIAPSPQLIVAWKSVASARLLTDVNVATCPVKADFSVTANGVTERVSLAGLIVTGTEAEATEPPMSLIVRFAV
jgi:hypothetical protein